MNLWLYFKDESTIISPAVIILSVYFMLPCIGIIGCIAYSIKFKNIMYFIPIYSIINKTYLLPMDDSDNSNMFKVDHSEQYHQDDTDKRVDNFFNKDKKILNDGQKRMVVYGAMDKEPRTIYQIVQPYVMKAAAVTGEAAIYAGKGIYTAISNGATWVYDKFVNNVIPYTTQQLPKLFFIVKNTKKEERVYSSDSFAVLEVEDGDFAEIKKKQHKGKNIKKRIIIPLGENDDPEFIKFLEKQNYVPDNSFPIDADSEQSETFMIPSANFMAVHDDAIKKILPEPAKNLGIAQYDTQEININPKQEIKAQEPKEHVPEENTNIRSYIDEMVSIKEVQDYKKVSKKVFKLKDCYIFELEGKNSIEYELLDGIEKDQHTKCGFLVKSNHFNLEKIESSSDSQPSFSGETPLLTEKLEKIVDGDIRVRVQIPTQKQQEKAKNKKQEEFILA